MICSLNQIENISRKAAHGAGLAWGLADEVGKALRWLHTYGLDGAPALAATLQRHSHFAYSQLAPVSLCGRWRAPCGMLDPLAVGAVASDCLPSDWRLQKHGVHIQTETIAQPLLVAGFIGYVAEIEDLFFTLKWPQVVLQGRRGGLKIAAQQHAIMAETANFMCCRITHGSQDTESGVWQTPGGTETVIATEVWECLENYAQRTYVETSEASRLTGAGAGLQDND